MPNIHSFNGDLLEFGEPGKFYNLLSDPNIHVNAHINQNEIDQLTFQINPYPTTYIKFDQSVSVNNQPLYNIKYFNNGSIQPKHKFEANNFNIHALANIKNFNNITLITALGYSFYVIHLNNQSYNLISTIHNPSLNPTGLLSHNKLKNYEVTSLWANDFINNIKIL